MTSDDDTPDLTPAQKLAAAVAKRNAALAGAAVDGVRGRRKGERAAAAHSASKNKPAARKG